MSHFLQVLQLQVSGGDAVTVRATPLESTSIKTGGRRRDPSSIKMAKRTVTAAKLRHKKKEADKRRKTSSLFRKLSNKRASAEMAGEWRFEILNYETVMVLVSPPSLLYSLGVTGLG